MNDRTKLGNDELVHRLDYDVARERAMTLEVLRDLNEMERRRLHLKLGYSSLFDYCTRKLKYSSSAASRRIQAARCIRRYPVALKMLEQNEVSLSTVATVASILTPENHRTILGRVRGASSREVERITCEFRPPVALRDRIQPVRVIATPGAGSEHRLFVQFLADDEFVKLFEEVKLLLARKGAGVSIADVMKAALKEYRDRHSPVSRQERRESGVTRTTVTEGKSGHDSPDSRRREWNDAGKSRHIPDEVRDAVFVRDHGRCVFVAGDGTRCESRHGIQIDHIKPFALGGTHDPSNLRLLCAAHNRSEAEIILGRKAMQPFWRPA